MLLNIFSRFVKRLFPPVRLHVQRTKPRFLMTAESLEIRTLLSVSVLNASGAGYTGLAFNQSGGYVPPDTNGAAGPTGYVEVVNQAIELFGNKTTGGGAVTDSLSNFFFKTGGLTRASSGSGQSDPTITYDEKIGRFIVGDQDVDFTNHVSAFDLAVSKSSNPTTLTASDWTFYKINTTQVNEDADYPGNFGYNADALVFTLNMFAVPGTNGTNHTQVVSVNAADLGSGVAQSSLHIYQNNVNDFSLRPTTMHDSVAGDPMWLVTEHGDGSSIDVYKMNSVLSNSATFRATNLTVNSYMSPDNPLNPNGTVITSNVDSRIIKAAEANNTIVASHPVAISATQDVAQWYAINVSSGTPVLSQQGRVSAGNNTYISYPAIDINSSGAIGMSYMQSGNDTPTDFMSMWVTGRTAADAAGTMQTPVLVSAGSGVANYKDFTSDGRAGDLSGINVDPVDGTFWAANEFANTLSTANWGTAIANFSISGSSVSSDLAVTMSGPSSITAGTNATYVVTITNNGPNAASGVVLTDTLPAGSVFVSMTQTSGSDVFTLAQSGGTATETAANTIASGSSDTFSIVVLAPSSLPGGTKFSNAATVSSTTGDPVSGNNSATVAGSIAAAATSTGSADLVVTNYAPATANEGDWITYTLTVKNNDPTSSATGVTLTDTLGTKVSYVGATASQGTYAQSNGVVTFNIGTLAPGAVATLTVKSLAIEDGAAVSNMAIAKSTSTDLNKANNSATSSTKIAEPAIVVSAPIVTSQTSVTNLAVATFTHANGTSPVGEFSANINWGDGTSSAGTITLSGTTYTVTGSHTYSSAGSYSIATKVSETGNNPAKYLANKVGDEIPELPDNRAAAAIENFTGLAELYIAPNSLSNRVTLTDLSEALNAIFVDTNRTDDQLQLSLLADTLKSTYKSGSKLDEVLNLINSVLS